ncbi:Short C-terminal domain-containing protein [Cellulomonas marina]|uniref:Short C-terminal domain-containing protein n=1 Tax=Cellulomonas marina TaxID=988821 RepID=A0A1I0Y448_9CELL|nr:Short C-terminal domain-containing protein [Cellulomonas marina]
MSGGALAPDGRDDEGPAAGSGRRAPRSLNDRVLHYGLTKGIARGLEIGIERLPVDATQKAALRARSTGIVSTLADTGVALANGAMAARAAATARTSAAQQPVVAVPAPTPTGGGSLIDQLERLAALRAQGHLDDEEFAAAKRRVLGHRS